MVAETIGGLSIVGYIRFIMRYCAAQVHANSIFNCEG